MRERAGVRELGLERRGIRLTLEREELTARAVEEEDEQPVGAGTKQSDS